jgi:hypothetical protein
MGKEPLALHAHDYVITTETYSSSSTLNEFYQVLATDTHEGVEFVVAIEANDYPIAGVMFHPETQNMRVFGDDVRALEGKVNNKTTDAINFHFSNYLHNAAKKSLDSHRFED